jgi:RNA polymerase sigma factor (sigma-70 family)
MEPNTPAERLLFMQQAGSRQEVPASPDHGDSFADVYLKTYRAMSVLAYATTGSMPLAEEIVQEAFLQLFRRWHEVQTPHAWIRRCVLSLSTSWLRRHLLERRHLTAVTHHSVSADEHENVELRQMFHVLSSRQRAALILRYYDGLSEAEIAAALGCRPGTVKSLLSRGITSLKKEFDA